MDEKDLRIQDLKEENRKLKKENEKLKNRCFVYTDGFICSLCPMECKNRKERFRGEAGAEND